MSSLSTPTNLILTIFTSEALPTMSMKSNEYLTQALPNSSFPPMSTTYHSKRYAIGSSTGSENASKNISGPPDQLRRPIPALFPTNPAALSLHPMRVNSTPTDTAGAQPAKLEVHSKRAGHKPAAASAAPLSLNTTQHHKPHAADNFVTNGHSTPRSQPTPAAKPDRCTRPHQDNTTRKAPFTSLPTSRCRQPDFTANNAPPPSTQHHQNDTLL